MEEEILDMVQRFYTAAKPKAAGGHTTTDVFMHLQGHYPSNDYTAADVYKALKAANYTDYSMGHDVYWAIELKNFSDN